MFEGLVGLMNVHPWVGAIITFVVTISVVGPIGAGIAWWFDRKYK